MNPLGPLLELGNTLITRIFPDKEQQAKAQLALLQLQQDGELKTLQTQMSAIIAEASSQDKWTSRARPSFMYVIYIMILMSIPIGILSAISPDTAKSIELGLQGWLSALPKELWELFGVGYLGYVGGRSWDKTQVLKGKK